MANNKLYTNSADMAPATINLKIANDIAQKIGINVSGQFLLGSIAPDAVFVRSNLTQEDFESSHYRCKSIKASWKEAVEEFKQAESPFMKGYALHVMTDVLWLSSVYAKLIKEYDDSFSKSVMTDDMDYIEKWLYRQNEYQNLWNAISGAKINNLHFYVSPGEVEIFKTQKAQSIKYDPVIDSMQYLTLDGIDKFIKKTVQRILLAVND